MNRRSRTINQIKSEVSKAKKTVKECNQALKDLTARLAELEVYSSSSEEEHEELKVGDKVIPINEPHKGRVGTITSAGNYWITVEADWATIINGRENRHYRKARHNLTKTTPE